MELISEYRSEEKSAEIYYNKTNKKYIVKCYESVAPDNIVLKHLTDGLRYGYRTLREAEISADEWVYPSSVDNWTFSDKDWE